MDKETPGVHTQERPRKDTGRSWPSGSQGQKLQEKAGRGLFIALALFVGIPLPGTGAWTGTLAASILDMKFKETVIAAMVGVLLAGVIMMTVSLAGVGAFGLVAGG